MYSPAECTYCHQSIDPYGYAAENYDSIGKYRELDYSDKAIDSTITLKNQGDLDGQYDSAISLSKALATSDTFGKCYTQWLRFGLGRELSITRDSGIIHVASERLKETNDVKELIVTIATSFAFRHRLPKGTQE